MISHLRIKDFAIIDEISVEFHQGLNIITGETGAGKSIVIEAINLALGARADTTFVRAGKEKAVVQLVVSDYPESVSVFLRENQLEDLEEDGSLIIQREVTLSGKNLCRINGQIIPLSQLNRLCKLLADIHGQYDHQSLLDPQLHIGFLDMYAKDRILPLKQEFEAHYALYSQLSARLSDLSKNEADYARKRDFMSYELEEIENANLIPGEDETLEERINILENSESIFSALSFSHEALQGDSGSIMEGLSSLQKNLEDISTISQDYQELLQDFNDAFYKLEDISREIGRKKDSVTFSQDELDTSIARLDEIQKLKVKYGKTIPDILAYKEKIQRELAEFQSFDQAKEALTAKLTKCREDLQNAADKLTAARKEVALPLQQAISNQLMELNFGNSNFSISIEKESLSGGYNKDGQDKVEFLISTNKGEPLKPLAKIASGGEMSRIMLAFKKVICDYDQIPTMVFDEIDTGISGIAASVVGRKLKEISETHQILCITHLPQIASCGKYNYKIQKESDETSTFTNIIPLSQEEKTLEIARLLGGANVTETTLKSAKELIDASL